MVADGSRRPAPWLELAVAPLARLMNVRRAARPRSEPHERTVTLR